MCRTLAVLIAYNCFQKRVLEERLKAIASKYKAYYTMPATKQAEILKNMMSSLSEKISLPNDYP